VSLVIRVLVGFAVATAGLTFLVYGIAQAIEVGSCGTDEYGNSVGPPCPPGMGPMIALMVVGTFVAIVGAAIAGRLIRFIAVIVVAVLAGVVLGIVDLHTDDTRPGYEIVVAVVAPMLLFSLPGLGKRRTARMPFARTAPSADSAERLRQLDQLKESGLMDEAAYEEARRRL
jgi:amino acid transporter